ncbi:unnamed protein product [Ambrosiozyma monospora]|uniref:Unnamed protein product n=1 Tax=Ambrosiozyma monospora TaxID=43982 RepID=A0ACB5TZS0_AMBMO|nr:unnamed protein product [Ambrosiozyma monospora]
MKKRVQRRHQITKKAIIKYVAFLTSFLETSKLTEVVSSQLLIPLINISEQEAVVEDSDEETSLPFLATRCMEKISSKIGISEYNILYSNARKVIVERRHERKTKRAQLTLNNPEVAAKRKLKKHMRGREKRKAEKDENGLYKPKKKKRV